MAVRAVRSGFVVRLRAAVALTGFACAVLAAPALALAPFNAPFREFPASLQNSAFATGDFDEDGRIDAVVASTGMELVFLRQAPSHEFEENARLPLTTLVHEMLSADLDGDGHLDLACLTSADELLVLSGDGTGAFPSSYTRPAPFGALWLVTADLDGAAPIDLVSLSYYSASLQKYFATPGGALVAPLSEATLSGPAAIAAGDLNGDGLDDLVLSHDFIHVLSILYTDPGGGTTSTWTLPNPSLYGTSLACADVDHDGRRDLLMSSGDGYGVGVYLADGAGGFSYPSFHGADPARVAFVLRVADVNGDTHPDLVLGGNQSRVLLGDGTGAFTPDFGLLPDVHANDALVLADWDGGPLDLLTYSSDGAGLLAFHGNGAGTFGQDERITAGFGAEVLAADLDLDGRTDLVQGGDGDPAVSVLWQTPFHTLGFPVSYPLPQAPSGLAVGKFDSDDYPDVAMCFTSGGLLIMPNGHNRDFGPDVSSSITGYPISIAVGNLDGDGQDDIVLVCSGGIETAPGLGAPSRPQFTPGISVHLSSSGYSNPTFIPATGSCPSRAAIGDVTMDGIPDIVVTMLCSSTFEVFPGDGAYGFDPSLLLLTSVGPPQDVALTDITGDGELDIVSAGQNGVLSVLPNLGGGSFDAPVDFPSVHTPRRLTVADVDGDGEKDVMALSYSAHLAVHRGLPGSGTLENAGRFGVMAQAGSVAAADVDDDGDLDLVAASHGSSHIQWLRNRTLSPGSVAGPGPQAEGALFLRAPAPNPAHGPVTLEYRLGSGAVASAQLLDVNGRLVRDLLPARMQAAGAHRVQWDLRLPDGRRAPSGVYFARVRAGEVTATRKIFVTR
ncbi:MAG: VCBS repeat-containing protein [Candidatus Eisenbacteria bacterium]|uniref:VCBS repeat-containing protein n=1 Tax=Eiseniibacteriota bacterium TaxID=2212470 RepID=A0A933W896_UNCEI|nr:VCBS repeat-containing protein [Candidatus Eisenbacteria bacterium]